MKFLLKFFFTIFKQIELKLQTQLSSKTNPFNIKNKTIFTEIHMTKKEFLLEV